MKQSVHREKQSVSSVETKMKQADYMTLMRRLWSKNHPKTLLYV